jgi:hypothetical protein
MVCPVCRVIVLSTVPLPSKSSVSGVELDTVVPILVRVTTVLVAVGTASNTVWFDSVLPESAIIIIIYFLSKNKVKHEITKYIIVNANS